MEQSMEPPAVAAGDETVPTAPHGTSAAPVAAWADEGRGAVTHVVPQPAIEGPPADEPAAEAATVDVVVVDEIELAVVEEEVVPGDERDEDPGADLPIGEGYEALLAAAEQVLDEVDDALTRLRSGSYGTCEVCGDGIADDHLSAWPTTRACERHLRSADQGAPA